MRPRLDEAAASGPEFILTDVPWGRGLWLEALMDARAGATRAGP